MSDVLDHIYVNVEYSDGQGEDEDGHPYYVASSDVLHFVTEGDSFEELLANIQECLDLCLKDTDSVAEFGVAPDAKITLVMEFPEHYAQTA